MQLLGLNVAGVQCRGRTPGTRSGSRPREADKNSFVMFVASYFKVEMSPHVDQYNSVLHSLKSVLTLLRRTSVQQSAQQQHAADLQMTRA